MNQLYPFGNACPESMNSLEISWLTNLPVKNVNKAIERLVAAGCLVPS